MSSIMKGCSTTCRRTSFGWQRWNRTWDARGLKRKCQLPKAHGAKKKPLTSTESTIPDELSGNTKGTGNTKEDGVELHLVEAVVGEEDTRVGVDVGPGVLGLAGFEEDLGSDVVDLADELEHLVVGEVLESELALSSVARIGLAEDGVAVTGNDLAGLEGAPDVLTDSLIGGVLADLGLHLLQPDEDLLVGKTVERTSETVEGGGIGKEGVGEGGADELAGVGRDVATFVVRVDGDVETHELNEGLVVTEAEEGGQVGGVVLVEVNGGDLALAKDIAVDATGNVRELGDPINDVSCGHPERDRDNLQVHRILEGGAPVVLLVDTLLVSLGERRVVVESSHSERELGHGVEGGRASVKDFLNELGEGGTGSPLLGKLGDLLLGGDLAGDKEPEETFGEGLGATGGLGEELLALGDGLATEADTLLYSQKYEKTNNTRRVDNAPASRTEPSQIRAGRPRIPLFRMMSWRRRRKETEDEPIELVNEDRSKGLFAVGSTGSLDLEKKNKDEREDLSHCTHVLDLGGNELGQALLQRESLG